MFKYLIVFLTSFSLVRVAESRGLKKESPAQEKVILSVFDLGFSKQNLCDLEVPGSDNLSKKFCYSANYFHQKYMLNSLTLEKMNDLNLMLLEQALFNTSNAYVQIEDYPLAVNELIQFLEKTQLKSQVSSNMYLDRLYKRVRIEIIRIAVLGQNPPQGLKRSFTSEKVKWAKLLLGIYLARTPDNAFLKKFSVQEYKDEFNDRDLEDELNNYKAQAMQRLSAVYLKEARTYQSQKDYKRCIDTLDYLLKWGSENPSYKDVKLEMKTVLTEFSIVVLDPYIISASKAAEYLDLKPEDVDAQVRQTLSEKAIEQIKGMGYKVAQ